MFIDACCTIGADGEMKETAGELIKQMDSAGVDWAVIHPAEQFYAFENETGNRLLLSLADEFKGRFIPTATVTPWRDDFVEIALKYIDKGARMLGFSPAVQGFNIAGHKLDRLLETLSGKKIPIYIHCGHHSNATPCQLFLLADRFKDIEFICGHSGSTDFKMDAVESCKLSTNFYLESSFARPALFVTVLKEIGFNKAVMGSGYPYNQFAYEWQEMNRLLPTEYKNNVLGDNLKKLIELD